MMEQGLSYYKAGQYADAIAAFDRLIKLTPDYAGAYFNKGNALVGMGRYEEAVAAYDQAIRLAPNVADAYTAKGRAGVCWPGGRSAENLRGRAHVRLPEVTIPHTRRRGLLRVAPDGSVRASVHRMTYLVYLNRRRQS